MSGLLKITEGAVCMHPRVKLVWVPTGESQKQLRYQCFDCGCLNGKAIAHSKAKPNTELVDFEALDRYHREYQERYDQFRQDRKTRYAEYLESDQSPYPRFKPERLALVGCRRMTSLARTREIFALLEPHAPADAEAT